MVTKRQCAIAALAAVAAGAVGLGVWTVVDLAGGGKSAADETKGTAYLCGDCKKGFLLTRKQLAEHHEAHWGQPVPCPHCGRAKTSQCVYCARCETFFQRDRLNPRQTCPKCGAPAVPR